MAKKEMSDIIVVLPGILGSELKKDGKKIWSMSGGGAWNALTTLGGSIKDLELDGDDPAADDLGDGVVASRLLPDLHLLPGFWTIDGYGKIRKTILRDFDVTEGENYFEFPYDWRRDNRVAGRKLRKASHDWLKAWRDKSGNADARLILLCHSMGGLVASGVPVSTKRITPVWSTKNLRSPESPSSTGVATQSQVLVAKV